MRKRYGFMALTLTGCMLIQPVMAATYTEDEIESRINEIGTAYSAGSIESKPDQSDGKTSEREENHRTLDAIDKRVNEVGEEYLNFYRNGNMYVNENYYSKYAKSGAAASGPIDLLSGLFGQSNMIQAVPEYDYSSFADSDEMEGMGETVEHDMASYESSDPNVFNTEEYSSVNESGFVSVATEPFSTFGADVDTASYSSLRRKLLEPYALDHGYFDLDNSAIRLEEMVNYFTYHYPDATDDKFGVTTTLNPCPWNTDSLLLKIGIKAEPVKEESKGSNIVFLIDTSGSMDWFDALPLVKSSMGILVDKLSENDMVSIVTYAGSEKVVMEGVSGEDKNKIMNAVNSLSAYGGTYGEGGINKAYEIAEKYKIEGGNNRIVLCTDGDFNLGVSSEAGLKDLISRKRETGIFFSCLGFGSGNYSDTTMLTLADNGNGNYFYIDCEKEAEKALDTEFFSTIYTVAKDTKFQVEFNPKTVKGYRLLGYEKRALAAEDFADDSKDGGEVGADHAVTVLYEVIPAESNYDIPIVESRYGSKKEESETNFDDEYLVVNLRYKEPDGDKSVLRSYPVSKADLREKMDPDTSWAAGVAQAAMLMRGSEYAGTSSFDEIYERLKQDPEIMDDDFKAQFLFMLRAMEAYVEG